MLPACEKENPAIVAMLLNHGVAVNKNCIQGWTALHEAVCRNNVEICEMLVKAGAKISTPNVYGITPIFVAAQSGNVDALRFLLKNGKGGILCLNHLRSFHTTFHTGFLSCLQAPISTARQQMEPRRFMKPVRTVTWRSWSSCCLKKLTPTNRAKPDCCRFT